MSGPLSFRVSVPSVVTLMDLSRYIASLLDW